jgi:hypothetical protein
MQMFIERALFLSRERHLVHLYFRGVCYFEFEYLNRMMFG